MEKYLENICREILELKNQEFHQCVKGMKPVYLKIKEVNLRYQQIDSRINEIERSIKNQGGIDEINKLQYNSLYYEELERGFALLERYEMKFIKAAEYEARNDFIMCVRTIKNIEKLYISNRNELSEFPDLINIIKSKITNFNTSLKQTLQDRITNFLFFRNNEAQNTVLCKIIKEVKTANKKQKKFKDDLGDEPEDFFEYISRTEFPLSDHVKLQIVKTLSRKDRKENIKKIKRILKKYQEDQLDTGTNPDDPDYAVNQEIIQKITLFFSDFGGKALA